MSQPNARSFRWEEYLEVATYLATGSFSFSAEAATRCAISRAYYAAHCYARNWAERYTGFRRTGNAEDHVLLIQAFRIQGRVDIASRLTILRERRNDCDYGDSIPPYPASVLIREAREVVKRLPSIGPLPRP